MKYLTYSYRLKDKHRNLLINESKFTNIVWNYCNDIQKRLVKDNKTWFSAFDFHSLTSGSIKEFDCKVLSSGGIQKIAAQYVLSRQTFKKPWLRYRGKKSLGWVPCKRKIVQVALNQFKIGETIFDCFTYRQIPKDSKIISQCSFNEDSRGRWFLNITFKIKPLQMHENTNTEIGIDLGLKTFATLSNGQKFEPKQSYRSLEKSIGQANKTNKLKLVRRLTKKVAYQRKDYLHKISSSICKTYEKIFVGDVNSASLAKTNMAKSVLDAGWSSFRQMLTYKSIMNGGKIVEVNEKFTTQTCSQCGNKPPERPKGIAGLGIREWICSLCNTVHDRDVNAAKNILRIGQDTLAEGICQTTKADNGFLLV